MKIYKYYICKEPGDDWGRYAYDTYAEAYRAAMSVGWCVVEATFEFEDSEIVEDFRDSREEVNK